MPLCEVSTTPAFQRLITQPWLARSPAVYADLCTNVLSGLLFNPESGDSPAMGKDTREADSTVTSGSELSVNVLAARVPTRRLS